MKKGIIFLTITLCLLFAGCSTKDVNELEGKYVSVYDSNIFYQFTDDGKYTTNNLNLNQYWDENGNGSYIIENNNVSLYDDHTATINFDLGYIYKDYLCVIVQGELPKNTKSETKIYTGTDENNSLTFYFESNGTYNEVPISEGKQVIDRKRSGTYTIKKNMVICTPDDTDLKTIFIQTDNGIYFPQYVKE